jgi:hypothetical protein
MLHVFGATKVALEYQLLVCQLVRLPQILPMHVVDVLVFTSADTSVCSVSAFQ